jgi:hypothetical protein
MAVHTKGSERDTGKREESNTDSRQKNEGTRARAHTRTHLERVFGVSLLDGVHTHEVYDLLDVTKLFA